MRDRNYQEDFNQNRSQRRKKTTGVIALGLAGVLVLGSLFAYFSDRLGGNPARVTTGTLDIQPQTSEEGYGIWIWKDTGDKVIQDEELIEYKNDNIVGGMVLNPGDMIVVKGDVVNKGSKSAWLMSNLNIKFTPEDVKINDTITSANKDDLNGAITFYKENALAGNIVEEDTTQSIDDSFSFNAESTNVINGTVEKETIDTAHNGSDILIGEDLYSGDILIFGMDNDATNMVQGLSIELTHTWKAVQYRNNPNPDWNNAMEVIGDK